MPQRSPSLPSELAAAVTQAALLLRSGATRVARPGTWGWRALLVALWVVGIAGDAYTTLAMMSTGLFEEANGVAAAGMKVLGPVGYTIAASALCAVMGVTNMGRASSRYGRLMVGLLTLIAVAKVYTAGSNLLLWLTA